MAAPAAGAGGRTTWKRRIGAAALVLTSAVAVAAVVTVVLSPAARAPETLVGAILALVGGALAGALAASLRVRTTVHSPDDRNGQKSGDLRRDLRTLTDALPSMIGYWDKHLVCRFANRAYEMAFGLEPQAMYGMRMRDLLGADLFERNLANVEAALRGESVTFEPDFKVTDDQPVNHSLAHYIPDIIDGEVTGFYVMVHNITSLKEAQRRLAESETFLEQAGAVSGVGGFRIDLQSGRQTWTRQTFKIYEMEAEVAPSAEELDKLMAPEVGARLWRAIRVAAETGVGYDIEIPVATARGRPIWIRTIGVVEFESGKPSRVVGAVQDITDRKVDQEALRVTSERLALATDAAAIGVWEWDINHNVLRWDDQMHRLYARVPSGGDVSYSLWTDSLHADDRERTLQEINTALNAERNFDTEFRIVLSTGETRHLKAAAQVQRDPGGTPLRMVGVSFDITKRKVVEQALIESELKFRSLFELSPVGITLNDMRTGRFLHLNDALAAPTGYTREELLGMTSWDITPARYVDQENAQLASLAEVGRYGPYEKEFLRKDGSTYAALLSGIRMKDASGLPMIWSIVQDISVRKAMESQLADAARRDKLTGLANRALFMERLESAVARVRDGAQPLFAVLFLDFDRFKLINDTLGHDAGDELLRQIARRLRRELRASDTLTVDEVGNVVSRFGGDEFLILINDLRTPDDAIRIAERLINALAPAYDLQGSEVHSSASIGIVTSDKCRTNAEDVVRNADVAMYEAKRAGRACSVVFNEAMQTRLTRHVTIENNLRRALGTSELYLVYQPIVELSTGTMVSVEALVRWKHPTLGDIPPSEFVPIAEESGLIVDLGQWVQKEACQAMALWRSEDPQRAPRTISVNVSRAELAMGRRLLEQVRTTLERAHLPAQCLQLEVTEREVMRHPEEARALLLEFQALGVQLAMDDFGTGTSSLSCLRNYPFHTIKIDRSFVQDLTGSPDVLAVIHATVNLVENLGMASLAEGVELPAQVAILLSLGCRYAQGYLFSRPVPAASLLDAITSRAHSEPVGA
jgi:diguanylate cyclase (GGDEF)-like protein/PAS domain S-box-containing protein